MRYLDKETSRTVSKQLQTIIDDLKSCECELNRLSRNIFDIWKGSAGKRLAEKCFEKSKNSFLLIYKIEDIKKEILEKT